ncbi:MAG: hypothetical protein RL318_1294 [Fibrobacterota bacterium]
MGLKRVLVLNGNPVAEPTSLCKALAERYAQEAKQAGHEVRTIHLGAMAFSHDLLHGYHSRTDLEPDLVAFQEALQWCEHFTLVHPVWWSDLPARLKGLFDRTFLPGYAFAMREGSPFPAKLLAGRTARVIYTQDAPDWYYRLVIGAPTRKMLGRGTLGFCGIKPVRFTAFGPVKSSTPANREAWLATVGALGREAR